jgi:hypothetical protein
MCYLLLIEERTGLQETDQKMKLQKKQAGWYKSAEFGIEIFYYCKSWEVSLNGEYKKSFGSLQSARKFATELAVA